MLKGQMSVGFVMRVAIGLIIIVALTYAVFEAEELAKRNSQKQVLVSAGEMAASQIVRVLGSLEKGQGAAFNMTLPLSSDPFMGQYGIVIEDRENVVYVRAQSQKWPELASRQPLYLASEKVVHNSRISYPPMMCMYVERGADSYTINITC